MSSRGPSSHFDVTTKSSKGCVDIYNLDKKICLLKIRDTFSLDWFMNTPSKIAYHPVMKVKMELLKIGWVDITVKQVAVEQQPTADSKISHHAHVIPVLEGQKQQLSDIIASRQETLWVHLKKTNTSLHDDLLHSKLKANTQSYDVYRTVKTDLSWESEWSLSRMCSDHFISLPGHTQYVSIEGTKMDTPRNLTMTCLHDNLLPLKCSRKGDYCCTRCKRQHGLSYCMIFPSQEQIQPCPLETYLLFRREAASLSCPYNMKLYSLPQKSWSQAAALCYEYRGFLPLLRSKSEMNNFIAFLKVSEVMPQIDALFIGLSKLSNRVSIVLSFDLCLILYFIMIQKELVTQTKSVADDICLAKW